MAPAGVNQLPLLPDSSGVSDTRLTSKDDLFWSSWFFLWISLSSVPIFFFCLRTVWLNSLFFFCKLSTCRALSSKILRTTFFALSALSSRFWLLLDDPQEGEEPSSPSACSDPVVEGRLCMAKPRLHKSTRQVCNWMQIETLSETTCKTHLRSPNNDCVLWFSHLDVVFLRVYRLKTLEPDIQTYMLSLACRGLATINRNRISPEDRRLDLTWVAIPAVRSSQK